MIPQRGKTWACVLTIMGLILTMGLADLDLAYAKRKKKGADDQEAAKKEAELKTTLEPLNTTLSELMAKIRARTLFSPEDAGKLVDVKFQLMDLIYEYPKSQQMAKPTFQAAVVYAEREQYIDAYELFQFVSTKFPKSPYGQKARVKLVLLKQKLGPDFYPQELSDASKADGKSKMAKKDASDKQTGKK